MRLARRSIKVVAISEDSMRKKTVGAMVVAFHLTGCGVISLPSPEADGNILIQADAKGMAAFGDVMNGLVTNGKATPDVDTPAWSARRHDVSNETARVAIVSRQVGFWQKLFGGGQNEQQN